MLDGLDAHGRGPARAHWVSATHKAESQGAGTPSPVGPQPPPLQEISLGSPQGAFLFFLEVVLVQQNEQAQGPWEGWVAGSPRAMQDPEFILP